MIQQQLHLTPKVVLYPSSANHVINPAIPMAEEILYVDHDSQSINAFKSTLQTIAQSSTK